MRMAELIEESGLPAEAIEYYLGEGLLQPGEGATPAGADYSYEHLRRLWLLDSLMTVGNMSGAETKAVLQAIDLGPLTALATAAEALVGPAADIDADEEEVTWADERYAELIAKTGWVTRPDSAVARQVRALLISARRTLDLDLVNVWPGYVEQADAIARLDVETIAAQQDLAATVGLSVIGTVLGTAYLNALRMLAHQHHSIQRWHQAGPADEVTVPDERPAGGFIKYL